MISRVSKYRRGSIEATLMYSALRQRPDRVIRLRRGGDGRECQEQTQNERSLAATAHVSHVRKSLQKHREGMLAQPLVADPPRVRERDRCGAQWCAMTWRRQ
jgi:hypothetical protein